jgi:hypothetical protein
VARLGGGGDEEAGDGEPDGGTDAEAGAEGADAPPLQATTDAMVKARNANVARDIGLLQGADAMPDPRRRIAADEMGDSRPR